MTKNELTRRAFNLLATATLTSAAIPSLAKAQQVPEFWHYLGAGGELDAVKALVAVANTQNPSTPIVDRVIPGSAAGLRQQLQTARLGGSPPIAAQSNPGAELRDASMSGALLNINDVWAEIEGDKIYPEALRRIISLGDDHFAVPISLSIVGNCFYNKAIFDKLGLAVPAGWDQFKETCEKIKAAGITPLGAASPHGYILQQWYGSMLTALGPENFWPFARGEISINGPELKKSFDLFNSHISAYFNPNWAGAKWSEVVDQMMRGEVAMFVVGDWAAGYMQQRGWKAGVDFDFFAGPGLEKTTLFQTDVAMALKGDKKQVARNFLKSVASPEGQAAFNRNKGSLAASSNAPTDFYSPVGKREFEKFTSKGEFTALPNPYGLLPIDFVIPFGTELERYASTRDTSAFTAALDVLEDKRKSLKQSGKFVAW